MIDGARVLAYGALGPAPAAAVAAGVTLEAHAVAVTQSLADDAVFLLYCNDDWQTLVAEGHADEQGARQAATAQFPRLEWRAYRPLTPEESAEIASTREFLRELVRGFPGEG